MKRIFTSGNYIIVDNGSTLFEYAMSKTVYTLDDATYFLVEQSGDGIGRTGIPVDDIPN